MDDKPCSRKASLPAFIRANLEAILAAWEGFAKGIVSARHMDTAALRDHASAMLCAIADDLDQTQSPREQLEKSQGRAPAKALVTAAELHGAARVASSLSDLKFCAHQT